MPQFRSPAARKAPTIHQSRFKSWRRIPSSTAYLERKGGASAVAVAARRETTESAVRALYGLVRRASVSSRRRVRAHDQSSTSAPRCCVRWPPGCQTLTARGFLGHACAIPHPYGWGAARRPRRRRYQPKAYASAPIRCQNAASGDFLHGGSRLDGVREAPLEQAVLVDVAIDRTRLEQLLVCPAGDDPALVEDDDLVRERNRRQPVSDDQRRPAAHRLTQAEPDPRLGGRIDRSGGVVEDEDPRIDGERARDRQPLALASRKRDPALADHSVVALRQTLHELVRLREPGDARELLVVEVADAEGDVLAHRGREEERILGDDSDRVPERGELDVADVDAVDGHTARG